MQSTLILCCGLAVTAGLAYYILFGVARLLEALMKNSGQSLKSIFILITLTGLVYIVINRNDADYMLQNLIEYVTFWDGDMARYDASSS